MDINELMSFFRKLDKYNELLINNKLTTDDIEDIKRQVKYFEFLDNKINEFQCSFGRILDYYKLLEKGYSINQVINFIIEDDAYFNECSDKLKKLEELRARMFGYPGNMMGDSAFTKYLRFLESKFPFINYDGKRQEKIIKDLKDYLHLNSSYNGYITNSDIEGNLFGINLGFIKYPKAYLYCTNQVHCGFNSKKIIIDDINERIDTKKLFLEIERNYWDNKSPCVIILNYGTEKLGSIDDIKLIKNYLVSRNIPHYIHVNVSFYQDFPNDLDIDSLSIHLFENAKVILYKNIYNNNLKINTTSVPLFSTYQKEREVLNRSVKDDNINYFKDLLEAKNISYYRSNNNSNIFIIVKPNDDICTKYQLETFFINNLEYARIIIFPYHNKETIKELVSDIKMEKEYKKV